MGRRLELVCVTSDNNNKFYSMQENTDGTWTAKWGRVGVTENTKIYPMSQWEKKHSEKIKKGYKDITSLRTEVVTATFKEVVDAEISKFVALLQSYSKRSVAESYNVSAEQVTQAQIDKAQEIINRISGMLNSKQFNKSVIDSLLTELYTVIPRKMKNVKDHILNGDGTADKAAHIIDREQALVDNMASQVTLAHTSDTTKTMTEVLGFTVERVNAEEEATIKKLMADNAHQFSRAFKVTNHKTERRHATKKTTSYKPWTKLLWHGSRNENWLSILSTGLMIRPSGVVLTGAMYGNGVYFATKARKSIGYTSARGSYWAGGNSDKAYLALYEVNTGMEYRVDRHDSSMYNMNEKNLKAKGQYDCLFAKAGVSLLNDEIIIYNADQCTVRYIVEIRG